jgi:short-subunit dehydrogenase
MSLEGKTIFITGASKGIGRELALFLASKKVNLILIARSKELLEDLRKEIEGKFANTLILAGDLANFNFIEKAVNDGLAKFSKIDILINNAGVGIFNSFENFSSQEIDTVIDTNVKGTFYLTQQLTKLFKAQKNGHILTLISDVGKRTIENGALYCASKYAQEAFTSALRKEVRSFNVKVSNIYSGLVDTEFHQDRMGSENHVDWLKVQDMVKSICFVLEQADHVVIDELVIHPISQEY